jgi:O-antigen biosynthesis protein
VTVASLDTRIASGTGVFEGSEAERLAGSLARRLGCEQALNLEPGEVPPIPTERLRGTVLVRDRGLEGLQDPLPFLRSLRELLRDAPGVVLATPERELAAGRHDGAPPRWNAHEFTELLSSEGLEVEWMGLGRPETDSLDRSMLLVAVGGARGSELRELLSTGGRSLMFDSSFSEQWPRNADRPPRICIASYEFVGPTRTGGIGTAYTSLAEALAEAGHEVTVLFTGWRDPDGRFSEWERHYERKGIRLFELRPDDFAAVHAGHYNAVRSYLTYMWLRDKDREDPFDVIHFPDTLGHGYYSVLAKRQGWAFAQTTLVTGVHSPSRWVLDINKASYLTGQEFADDFIERAAVGGSDVVISPSAYLLDWMRSRGWNLPERVYVQQYVGSRALRRAPEQIGVGERRPGSERSRDEIVFFGRLEMRKGLLLFCDALDILAEEASLPNVSISFLGKQAVVLHIWAEDYLKGRATRWPWKWRILDRLKQPEAISYLTRDGGRRLAVMPSLADNTPNTVMEATALGIPFIASRAGGTAELIDPLDLGRCTFDPTGREPAVALAEALREAVERNEFRPARPAVSPARNEQVHVRWHEAVAADSRPRAPAPEPARGPQPPVTALVLTREGSLAAETASAVEAQDYPLVEKLLWEARGVGRKSRDRIEHVRADLAARGWKLLGPDPAGGAAAANLAATEAAGDYVLICEEGVIPEPGLVSSLVRIAEEAEADVVSCVSRCGPGEEPEFMVPQGGPALAGLLYRSFAAGAYVIRTGAFQRSAGFDPRAEPGTESHELLCRAALEGFKMEVVPEPLVREPAIGGERPVPIDYHGGGLSVVRAYEDRAAKGLEGLPTVARAHWVMSRERARLVEDLLHSKSWRVTKPLRWVMKLGRRLRTGGREGPEP